MSAISHLEIDQQWLFSYGYGYFVEFAAMFRDDELVTDLDGPRYVTTVASMRERLDVMGVTVGAARARLNVAYDDALIMAEREEDDPPEALDDFLAQVTPTLTKWDADAPEPPGWTADEDPRLVLRLLLDHARDDAHVALDLADVALRGYVQGTTNLCERAFELLHGRAFAVSPTIVLTEGSTDAELISAAIDVRAPHLRGYLRVLDYDFKPEGSTSALVRAVRAYAAAGITNRIVALFDNDAAAAEALANLFGQALPENFRVIALPHLTFAESYPTLGPSGESNMDINGLAVSSELFFGRDVLTDEKGNLAPVQWTGYMSKAARYQGEVLGKRALQEKFRAKAAAARTRGHTLETEDWTGIDLLVQAVVHAFN